MKHRFTVAAIAATIAATGVATPAMAKDVDFLPGQTLSPEAEAFHHDRHQADDDKKSDDAKDNKADKNKKKDPKAQAEQAELTGKRLDNAKKGVDTAKGIVDTLGGLGDAFGLTGGGEKASEAGADC